MASTKETTVPASDETTDTQEPPLSSSPSPSSPSAQNDHAPPSQDQQTAQDAVDKIPSSNFEISTSSLYSLSSGTSLQSNDDDTMDNNNNNNNITKKEEPPYIYNGNPPQLRDLGRRIQHVQIDPSLQRLPARCFARCFGLRTVEFTTTTTTNSKNTIVQLEEIGEEAFLLCRNLLEISIPPSLPYLPYAAMSGCGRLTQVTLQEGLIKIGMQAFQQCSKLQTIELPSTMVELGNAAFKGCYDLEHVIFRGDGNDDSTNSSHSPQSQRQRLKRIPAHTFCMCHSLTEIELPSSVEELGDECFSNCVSLQVVKKRKKKNDNHSNEEDSEKVTIGHGCFLQCMSLKELLLVDNATTNTPTSSGVSSVSSSLLEISSIGEMAFEGCGQLASKYKELRPTRKMSLQSRESIRKSLMAMMPAAASSFNSSSPSAAAAAAAGGGGGGNDSTSKMTTNQSSSGRAIKSRLG
ncbi:unnamed protein product [Cylindrotheca closterium]|uniref:Uncharacterized protein n=1 Tax=Cylindrotheca closterium TaxID=2856 RepID=A0AAD2FXT7_9STRA|nr:unnamed protein product [Cylindrotheca closterium]